MSHIAKTFRNYGKKNTISVIVINFLILGFLFYFMRFGFLKNYEHFQERWIICMDLLEKGILYGSQPYCAQGPFVFLTGYFMKIIVGLGGFINGMIILSLIIHTISFWILYKIICKNRKDVYILLIFYISTIYFISLGNYASLLSMFFLLVGFYLINYTSLKYKEFIGGLMFAFSIFSKFTSFIPTALIILFYTKINIKKMFKIGIPILITAIILKLYFPLFLEYSLLSHVVANWFITYPNNFTFGNLMYLFSFFILIYMIIKKRSNNALIVLISFIFISLRTPNDFNFLSRFLLPTIPIFIIVFFKWKNEMIKSINKKLIYVVTLMVFILPIIYILFINGLYVNLQEEVNYGISFIPKQEGYVFGDSLSRMVMYNLDINYEKYDIITAKMDDYYTPGLIELGIVNITRWRSNNTYLKNIESDRYGLIIIGPEVWRGEVYNLFNKTKKLHEYCSFIMPNLEHQGITDRHWILLNFKDNDVCPNIQKKVGYYYKDHIDSICKKSFNIGEQIKTQLRFNGITLKNRCKYDTDLLKTFNTRHSLSLKKLSILIILISIVVFFYKYHKGLNKKII